MNTILEQFQDKINGTFSFFDRMIIKGHIRQFFSTSGKGFFLSEQNVLFKDFSAYANQVTTDIASHVKSMAASEKRPLIYLASSKDSKEQTALEILQNQPVDEGLICILSVVEYCQTLQPRKHDNGLLSLDTVNRKCKYYYFYFLDKHFGFMHVKLQTWFPFLIQVYINGREMMKHVFDKNGISYKKKKVRNRSYTGYNVWSPETFQLFETISDGRYLIRGFTNKEIRRRICTDNPDSARERGRMSRTFAKLRAHGLIRKIPHSRRYLVSDKGRRVMGALIETKRKTYPELAAQ